MMDGARGRFVTCALWSGQQQYLFAKGLTGY
jgi:hypothetical protein